MPDHVRTRFCGERHTGHTAGSTAVLEYLSGFGVLGLNNGVTNIPKGSAVCFNGIDGKKIIVVAGTYGSSFCGGGAGFHKSDRFKVVGVACVTLAKTNGTGLILLEGRTSVGRLRTATANGAVLCLAGTAGIMRALTAATYGARVGFGINSGGATTSEEIVILPWRI